MTGSTSVPIVLAVDVESDARHVAPGGGVEIAGLLRTLEVLGALRPRLEDATGAPVRFAWFVRMDPQTASQGARPDALVEAAHTAFESIRSAGDAIGLHTHAGRWDAAARRWLIDHADPAWVDHCLVSSAAAYRQRFGQPCREHRFGDRFSSPAVFRRLADLGVRVDLTTEPGQRGGHSPDGVSRFLGRVPGYPHAPRSVHRGGDGQPWILPLTAADPAPALSLSRRWLRRIRYAGQPRHRTLLLDRTWPTAGLPWDLAEAQLDSGARHLAFAIRSDLILGPRWAGVAAVLEELLVRPLVRRLVFVGGEEAVARSGAV